MKISLVFTACTLSLSQAFAPINPSQYVNDAGSHLLNRIYGDKDIIYAPFRLHRTRSAVRFMKNNDENDDIEEPKNISTQGNNVGSFFDAMLGEIFHEFFSIDAKHDLISRHIFQKFRIQDYLQVTYYFCLLLISCYRLLTRLGIPASGCKGDSASQLQCQQLY
jgi:hypothetical protein